MARACNHAMRLRPNPVRAQLPSTSRGRAGHTKLAVHAQLPAEDDAYPAAEQLKKVKVSQVHAGMFAKTSTRLFPWICSDDQQGLIICCFLLVAKQSVRRSRRRGTGGARQSLVSVGTARGGGDQWSSDFELTLRQLHLDDLVEDGQRDAHVLVRLLVQQHTQFGMSIKGQVVTSFRKICDSCSSPYCANIDEKFDLTVLSSSRKNQSGLPELGDSDPSVVYVRPGAEIDLDSVIQETVRLTASAKSSCSEACEKSTIVWQYSGKQKTNSSSSQRWSKLLDLKKTLSKAPR